jgi:SET domain-containing protein
MDINTLLFFILMILIIYIYFFEYNNKKNKIIVKSSNLGGTFGRGVYANMSIKKGELIEEGYLLLYDGENPLKCGLYRHYLYGLTDRPGVGFPLGTGGLYNHSSTDSNAYFVTFNDKFQIFAKKDIYDGEEILLCYGCNHPDSSRHFNYAESHGLKLDS